MAIWRLAKHYGSYREVIALVVSSLQLLTIVIIAGVALTAGPLQPANGGYYNTAVLVQSVQQASNQHYQQLGMAINVTKVSCVLDPGKSYTCALHEVSTVGSGPDATQYPYAVPLIVVVSDNGNQWRSQ